MRLFLLGLSFLSYSSLSHSAESYASYAQCKSAFSQLSSKSQNVVNFCADKLSSAQDLCVVEKLKTKTDYPGMMESEKVVVERNFGNECEVTLKTAAIAASNRAVAAANAASAGKAAPVPPGAAAVPAQNANNAIALANAGNQPTPQPVAPAKPAAATQQPATTESAAAPKVTTDAPVAANSPTAAPTAAATPKPVIETLPSGGTKVTVQNENGTVTTSFTDANGNAVGAPTTVTAKEASEVVKDLPSTQGEVEKVQRSMDAGCGPAPKTAISANADAKTAALEKAVTVGTNAIETNASGVPQFINTSATLKSLQSRFKIYTAGKSTCTKTAEAANFLCVESCGAKSVKTLMNVAGPVMAVISSAQKTCSSSAKLTKFINTALTVAKGVCIASKATCDISCSTASNTLNSLQGTDLGTLEKAIDVDKVSLVAKCAAMNAGAATCQESVNFRANDMKRQIASLRANLKTEVSPVEGTTAQLVAKCSSYASEVASFAIQALGTYSAYKNAQSCADTLATSANSGAVSMQQYCEIAANASSQVCACQKDNMATGCPGAILAEQNKFKNTDTGANLQATSGVSAFAGGFKPAAGTTSALGKTSGTTTASGALGVSAVGPGSATGSGSASSGYSGGASGGLMAPGADGKTASDVASGANGDKKKLAYPGFNDGSGGGSGAGGNGDNATSGALSTTDMAAVQRKIASEKIAAEVSPASGKSNWEKVRSMYLIKETSFIVGQ